MSVYKGPTEGGSGGKRGHSNMSHWGYTNEVKEAARRRRRLESKQIAREAADDASAKPQRKPKTS